MNLRSYLIRFPTRLGVATVTLASFGLVGAGLALAAPTQAADVPPVVGLGPNGEQPGILTGPPSAPVSTAVTLTLSSALPGLITFKSGNSVLGTASCIVLPGASNCYNLPFNFTTSMTSEVLSVAAFSGSGNSISNTLSLTVGTASTTTVITAPNEGKVGQSATITSTVTSGGGSAYNPAGQVVVRDASNAVIHTGSLTSSVAGQSIMYFRFTPTTAGTFVFIATYEPNSSSATGSTSAQDALIASPSGGTISLAAPPTMSLNTPVVLTASLVPSNTQGTVGFTANGAPISAAVPINNGTASYTWTPNIAGNVTLGAEYTTNSVGSGSTTDVVTVSQPTTSDVITLVQPGLGAWGNLTTHQMGNGSNFAFQASTHSGAGVSLSETGPCTVAGLTLTVNLGAGVCNLKASTPGGNGYQGVNYTYTINLIPGTQTATLSAPVSGRYKLKKVLVLESSTQQDTNAGQNISWRLKKKGRSNCKIINRNSGAVTLRILKKRACTVTGKAPSVSGAWEPFKTARKYRGR